MQESFSWKHFDRMARVLEAMGYVVAVFGPLFGILLIIFGDLAFKLTGVAVILASVLVAMYHFSFSLLMNAIRDLKPKVD